MEFILKYKHVILYLSINLITNFTKYFIFIYIKNILNSNNYFIYYPYQV